jgi:uncharacterized membrane protein
VIVEALRFLLIPGVGAVAAVLVFRSVSAAWWERRFRRRSVLVVAVVLAGLMAASMLTARYLTWHSFVHDLGSYDQKVWLAATRVSPAEMVTQTSRGGVELAPCGQARYWGICHFQPLYVVFAVLYRAWASPLVLLGAQVLLVMAAAIPCYRLARAKLATGPAAALVVVLYLLQPAVQFNALLDFRPDHIAIPFLFWAYLLAERGRAGGAAAAAAVPALAKESLLLALTGFGLYLAADRRRVWLGLGVAVASALAFAVVMSHVLAGPVRSEAALMVARYFSGGALAPALLARKVVYLVALLAPFAFLPLLAPRLLLPAVPSIAIALLSNDVTHTSIQSQYSAAAIAPLFAGLLSVLTWLPKRLGERATPARVLGALVVFSAAMSLALGPTPLSMNFWDERWGRHWHYSRYLPDRQEALNAAAALIPVDPGVMVVAQNDVNSARLAHRHFYFAFPSGLERADYVLLDTRRMPFVYWVAKEPDRYAAIVGELRASSDYRVAFERDGVLLFARAGARRPGAPDPQRAPAPPGAMPR